MIGVSSIEKSELDAILSTHGGNEAFRAALDGVSSSEELMITLARYIHFNSPFGGGVANLAGEVAVRSDLFRDPDEPVEQLADRSSRIASDIFIAAVDEFADSNTTSRATHRSLAQATLKGAGIYFEFHGERLNAMIRPDAQMLRMNACVREGYGLNQSVDDPKLFRAIGYHVGSELLADEEFNILHEYLHMKHPALVDFLSKTPIDIGGTSLPGYIWISVHTSVEADHFDCALRCANNAMRLYAGKRDREAVKSLILDGLMDFAAVQTEFMQGLTARQ